MFLNNVFQGPKCGSPALRWALGKACLALQPELFSQPGKVSLFEQRQQPS